MEHPRQYIAVGLVMGCTFSLCARAETPPPSPTPKSGTLAALAGDRSLKRASGVDVDTPIVITDDNLARLADGAVITLMTSTIAEVSEIDPVDEPDQKTREKWRKRVLAQSAVIAKLEARRSAIGAEIGRLERGRLDARTLDRIERAEAKLRVADDDLEREKANLSKLIRAARREGAQPGWFR